jgi:hypothetical protein
MRNPEQQDNKLSLFLSNNIRWIKFENKKNIYILFCLLILKFRAL